MLKTQNKLYKKVNITYNNFGDKMKNFEGVYYRINKNNINIAVIAGVNNSIKDPHSFIQVIDNITLESKYYRFDINEYIKKEKFFKVGENTFGKDFLELNLDEYKGKIKFKDLQKLEESSVMGCFKNLKIMPCNHYIFFLRGNTEGKLIIKEKEINFNNGVGYMEGDAGSLFPSKYIWIQSNSGSRVEEESVITGAFAKVLGKIFFYLIFNIDGKTYRLATYDLGRVEKLYKDGEKIHILIMQKNIGISLEISKGEEEYELKYPRKGFMVDGVKETLNGKIKFKMYAEGKIIYDEEFTECAIEEKFT